MTKKALPALVAPDLISIAEGAGILRLSTKTVRSMVASGALRAYRVGAIKLYLDRQDVLGQIVPVPSVRDSVEGRR